MDIREAIRNISGVQAERVVLATVDAIDEENLTCNVTPLPDGAPLLDINLSIDVATHGGLTILPAVGDFVLVALTSDCTGYVINSGKGRIVLNGGSNGGLVVIDRLVDKLNQLEKEVNDLKNVFSSWSPVVQDGGAALKTSVASWASATIETTKVEDLEDTNVKH